MESTIPSTATIEGMVNASAIITLYNKDSESIQVDSDKVDYWLRLGFTRTPQDLESLASEVDALGDAIGAPWADYLRACHAAGHIDGQAQEIARLSLEAFCEACNRLHLAIHATYAPLETTTEEA